MQYSTQLSETARCPWTTIIGEQIDCKPWTDVYGNEHLTKCPASWTFFLECVQLYLQTVFRTDAAEEECFLISNRLKKPNKIPIWDFVQRIQCLNGYVELLMCLFYSSKAAMSMKVCSYLMMPTWQATFSGWFLRTGRTNMSSVELWYHKVTGNFLKSLNTSRRPPQPRRLEKDLRMQPSLATHLRRRWSPLVTRF